MACTHKDSCAMFPLISLNSALQIWQTFYCDTKHESCQRFQRASSGLAVPVNLLPNGKELDLSPETGFAPAPKAAAPAIQAAKPAGKPAAAKPVTPPQAAMPAPAKAARPELTGTLNSGAVYSYYMRVRIKDVAGLAEKILHEITSIGIGIDASIIKPPMADGSRCLIIISDHGPEVDLFRAILRIEGIDGVLSKVKSISLEKQEAMQAA